ncbi:hypothetical protein PMAYCL1PPCAC_10705, partial [Pristionchus mayeri]
DTRCTEDAEGGRDSQCSEDTEDAEERRAWNDEEARNLLQEALDTPLPDSDDDFDLDFEEAPSGSAVTAGNHGDKQNRRPLIEFGKTAPPDASEYRTHIAIEKGGNFARKRDMVFINSRNRAEREARMRAQRGETEAEDEEEQFENFAGWQFTGRDVDEKQLEQLDRPRRQYQPKPYRHYQYRPFRGRQRNIPCYELLSREEAEALLK